jgi:hypothetical protein
MGDLNPPRWRQRLKKELAFRPAFEDLDQKAWEQLLRKRRITSTNHDTVLSLDWPHFCSHATPACGGREGWCYTFQGNQATKLHNRHVAMVDVLARRFPRLFAERVESEVRQTVADGLMKYANLRYSGSGEVVEAHVTALEQIALRGVSLWGFTRSLRLAQELRKIGASVIISCDRSSPEGFAECAMAAGFALAYSSMGVEDHPHPKALVTFPVHRGGRVREVVDTPSLCPKVVAEFLHGCRPAASCQLICTRCHAPGRVH